MTCFIVVLETNPECLQGMLVLLASFPGACVVQRMYVVAAVRILQYLKVVKHDLERVINKYYQPPAYSQLFYEKYITNIRRFLYS